MSRKDMNNGYVNSCEIGRKRRWRSVATYNAESMLPLDPETPSNAQRGIQAIFMKAVEPVGPAIVDTIDVADFTPALLRADGCRRIERMIIADLLEHAAIVDRAAVIQRHTVIFGCVQRLKPVHVI